MAHRAKVTRGNEKIIEAVRKYPCWYAVTEESYHEKTAKENAWEKVAEDCKMDASDMKKIWRHKIQRLRQATMYVT